MNQQNQSSAIAALRISSQFQLHGFSSEDLDDLVVDVAHAKASNEANQVCELNAEAVIDNAEASASEINNGGADDQIAFLVTELGEKGTIQSIHQATEGAANISVEPFLIYSDAEQGYWCNGFGWCSHPEGGTGFSIDDVLQGKAVIADFTAVVGKPAEDLGWYWTKNPEHILSGSQGVDFDGPYPSQEEAGRDAIATLCLKPAMIGVADGQYVLFVDVATKQ